MHKQKHCFIYKTILFSLGLHAWMHRLLWNRLAVVEDGRPTVYYQFLANVIEQNLTEIVLPASMTSLHGARFLRTHQFRPQLIYFGSGHEQGEILIELALYWNVLQPGGILFGTDWSWISVRCDVKKFMYMRNLRVERFKSTWIFTKPLDS